ncbi:CCAAT-binding protein subunit HAP3 [Calycina marina]|uniref:CCAAT-binding protein subunit HAP3 n=1 Tax=Calycina marina TaxID=1763456 RepID=A0A9P7ZBX6_9HELO|nr:CCAAT-binding protein subunit HAP3 [Calycina marina]
MSDSPSDPKETEVEQGPQSPNPEQPMEGNIGFEFEVKEQDRWLPIANEHPILRARRSVVTGVASLLPSHAHVTFWPLSTRPRERKRLNHWLCHWSQSHIMSHASSSPPPPETTRSSKSGKYDDSSDANIRNFAPVARIMKMALPENAKIAKEAKECMQECVSEFISFITSEASEKCHQEKRKTVNGEDILFAMTSLGFENYAEALKIYLSKYRETQSTRGDNNRPESQGYGSTATGTGMNPSTGGFTGGDGSNIMGGQLPEVEHDNGAYGGLYGAPSHNGVSGGDGY